MSALADQKLLVLGLGESGQAVARWAAWRGARVALADSRADWPAGRELAIDLGAPLALGPFDSRLLDGIDRVAVSPGIDPRGGLVAEARARGIPVCGEMSLFAEALSELGARAATRIVAITGTNGKTTTTALAGALCRAAGRDVEVAGNISPAALAVLLERCRMGRPLPEVWVLELSSFQLETFAPLVADAATVLNVSDDHLDRYDGLADYAATKAAIFAGEGCMVLNRDDPAVAAMARPGRDMCMFGLAAPAGEQDYGLLIRDGREWLCRGDTPLLPVADLRLQGRHNLANLQAALALCAAIGIEGEPVLRAAAQFAGLPHRVELVARRRDGVVYIDDSKGTNVGATVAALAGLGRPAVLIAGGDGKGQDFSPLRDAFAAHARAVVLIGRDAGRIAAVVEGCGVPLLQAADLDVAVQQASELARPGDAVLLSPACASLDMFRNYAHRAEVFVTAALRQPDVEAA